MKKFMNSADDFLKESLQGFGAAHEDIVSCYYDPNFITRSSPTKDGKVALISGGGSFNKTLIQSLRNHNINLVIPESQILNYKESLIFGLLGYLRINNKINCLRSVTGASKDHSSGDIYD